MMLNNELAGHLREAVTGIIKSKVAYKNYEEFLKSHTDDKLPYTGRSFAASGSGLLPIRCRRNLQAGILDYEDQESNQALRQSIGIARSRYDSSPNRSLHNHSSDSDISKSYRKPPPERRFSNINKNKQEENPNEVENLKIVNEEDLYKISRFRTDIEFSSPNLTTKKRKQMHVSVAGEQPRLTKAGTIMLDGSESGEKLFLQKTPSSGKIGIESRDEKPNEYELKAVGEYMHSSNPIHSQTVSFRFMEKDPDFQSKIVSLHATVAALLRKKIRNAWTSIIVAGPGRRPSIREITDTGNMRFELRSIPSISEEMSRMVSTSRQNLAVETERSVSFNLADPTQNKDIDYHKVITVARLFIRLQQNAHVTAYHALHKLARLLTEDTETEKHRKAQPAISLLEKMKDRCVRGVMARLRLTTLTNRLDAAASENNSFKLTIAIGRLLQSLQRKQLVTIETLLRHAKDSLAESAHSQETNRLKHWLISRLRFSSIAKQSSVLVSLMAATVGSSMDNKKKLAVVALKSCAMAKCRTVVVKLVSHSLISHKREYFSKMVKDMKNRSISRLILSLTSKQAWSIAKLVSRSQQLVAIQKALIGRLFASQRSKTIGVMSALRNHWKNSNILFECLARHIKSRKTILAKMVQITKLKVSYCLRKLKIQSERAFEAEKTESAQMLNQRLALMSIFSKIALKKAMVLQRFRIILLQEESSKTDIFGLKLRRQLTACRLRLSHTSKLAFSISKLRGFRSASLIEEGQMALSKLNKTYAISSLFRYQQQKKASGFNRLQAWNIACMRQEKSNQRVKISSVRRLVACFEFKYAGAFKTMHAHSLHQGYKKGFLLVTMMVEKSVLKSNKSFVVSELKVHSVKLRKLQNVCRAVEKNRLRQAFQIFLLRITNRYHQRTSSATALESLISRLTITRFKTAFTVLTRIDSLRKRRSVAISLIAAACKTKMTAAMTSLVRNKERMTVVATNRCCAAVEGVKKLALELDTRVRLEVIKGASLIRRLGYLKRKELERKENLSKLKKIVLLFMRVSTDFQLRKVLEKMRSLKSKTKEFSHNPEPEPIVPIIIEPLTILDEGSAKISICDKDSSAGLASARDTYLDPLPTDREFSDRLLYNCQSFTDRLRNESIRAVRASYETKNTETDRVVTKDSECDPREVEVLCKETDTQSIELQVEAKRKSKMDFLLKKQACTIFRMLLEPKLSEAEDCEQGKMSAFASIFLVSQAKRKLLMSGKLAMISQMIEANVEAAKAELAEITYLENAEATLKRRADLRSYIFVERLASLDTLLSVKRQALQLWSFILLSGRIS